MSNTTSDVDNREENIKEKEHHDNADFMKDMDKDKIDETNVKQCRKKEGLQLPKKGENESMVANKDLANDTQKKNSVNDKQKEVDSESIVANVDKKQHKGENETIVANKDLANDTQDKGNVDARQAKGANETIVAKKILDVDISKNLNEDLKENVDKGKKNSR